MSTFSETLNFENSVVKEGEEFRVNTYADNSQSLPSATTLKDGGFVVTWTSSGQDGDSSGIYGQRYDADGTAIGGEFQVNTYTTSQQISPSLTALSDGGFVVTWSSSLQDGDSRGIYGQRYDANGLALGNEFQVNTYTTWAQHRASVTSLSDGGFVVTWDSNFQDGSSDGIYGQRYDANGTAAGAEFQINTYTIGSQSSPSATALNDGGFVVTWQSSGYGIYGQRYDASGMLIGEEFRVNTYTIPSQIQPSIASLTNGGFVVTWQSSSQDGDSGGIFGQRFDPNGNAVGDEFQINTYTTGYQGEPSATALNDGGFVVTWTSSGQDGDSFGIYGQRYDADGTAIGGEFQVNTYTTKMQREASVTALNDGGFVVTWSSLGQDGDSYGIYGQRFSTTSGEPNLIEGTLGDDLLNGTEAADTIYGFDGNDEIHALGGDDVLEGGAGVNMLEAGLGNDTIILDGNGTYGSGLAALNISSSLQTGTEELINLYGKTRFEDVMDGGADTDTVMLTDASDAFFLHDSFSGFHSYVTLANDYEGRAGTARIENIENINAGNGDDIVDLTSPDYSLAGQNITVNGGEGHDTLWGSDADEALYGDDGDDVLFGGAGTNTLTGGLGADEFQFTKTSTDDTVADYDLSSGDQLKFFYEAGSQESDWSFSILNGDLRWGENTIDFGTMEVTALDELSILVEEIGSGKASQIEYMPTLGDEMLRLDLYPALYEQDYYSKMITDLQFAEFNELATKIDADLTFLGGLNEVAAATGLDADGNGFTYSAGAVYNNTYNTVEISADISNFTIDGVEANPISLQTLLETASAATGQVGGLFHSITLAANSVDYLTLEHSTNGLSLVYDNATNGMINELRLDGSFDNDLKKVIPVVSNLLTFDFNDPIALLGSPEFLETSANLDSLATLTGVSILQKGVADPYVQLTATDTAVNVAYKDWDIVGTIEVSETWQPDPDVVLSTLQNLLTGSINPDLSELASLVEGFGPLSLSILHDDAGKLAEGIIHDFGDLIGALDQEPGDEFIYGTTAEDSYAIDSNGLAAVVFKDRTFDEAQTVNLLDTMGLAIPSSEEFVLV